MPPVVGVGALVGWSPNAGAVSAFSPTDIAGLQLWLDASDESTITESSGAVSQWDDKSGNGNHATQDISSQQPSTGVETVNGLNVVTYDGSSNYQSLEAASTLIAAEGTVFTVFRNDSSTFYSPLWNRRDNNGYVFLADQGSSATAISNDASGSLSVNGSAASPTTRGDVYTVYGTALTLARVENLIPTAAGDNYVTHYWSDGLAFTGVDCARLVFNRVLTAEEVASVETYLASKWGVTLS